jgi:hypothetical protein
MPFQFGLNSALPEGVTVAWGARWIFPDDILWDRTSWIGEDGSERVALARWLDGGNEPKAGALWKARTTARHILTETSEQTTLFEDAHGIIVANTNRSFGYVYVAAWLKGGA